MMTEELKKELKEMLVKSFSQHMDKIMSHVERIYDSVPCEVKDKDAYVKTVINNIFSGMDQTTADFEKRMAGELDRLNKLSKGANNG